MNDPLDFAVYCMRYADQIYVRERVGGKWGSYPLSNIALADQQKHIRRWFNEGYPPVLVSKENQ